MKKKTAVVLLSGGLDSATCLYYALRRGYNIACLAFDYSQKHKRELSAARKLAGINGLKLAVLKIKFPWTTASLVAGGPAVEDFRDFSRDVPATYVPGRNTVFLSYALSYAESIGASAIFIGANAVDFSGYPDCRPAYFKAWRRLAASLGLQIRVAAPLIELKKSAIIRLGKKLGVPYALTWSCYRGGARPCGKCDSCVIRAKGFSQAGLADPSLGAKK